MKLFLVRHGQTTANQQKIYAGQTDVLLTEQGRQEAEAIRPILEQFTFDRVYSSDLTRALDTQKLALPGATAIQTPLLREFDEGRLVGMSFAEVQALTDDNYRRRRDYTPYGGESADMVCARLRKFLSILEADPCDTAIAFAHNGIMNMMLRVALGDELDYTGVPSKNCAIHVFEYFKGRWRLLAWNYMGKL